jgi:hypothetical protein
VAAEAVGVGGGAAAEAVEVGEAPTVGGVPVVGVPVGAVPVVGGGEVVGGRLVVRARVGETEVGGGVYGVVGAAGVGVLVLAWMTGVGVAATTGSGRTSR